jgi:heavy metal efflux system protein
MLSKLIDFCLETRWLVLVGVVLLAATGTYVALQLPVDAFPDLTNNQVTIITECGPMSPGEVERLVTYPLETALMGIPKTLQLRSVSKLGLSLITMVMDDSVGVYFARQLVNERLREARSRLPQGLEPVLGPVATAFGENYQFTIDGPGLSLLDKKTLQDWVIRPQLRTVSGINEVNSWGGFTRQITVEADPELLRRYNLSIRDLIDVLGAANTNFGGGFIEHQAEQYNVLGMGRYETPADIEQTVIKENRGVPVLLRDVARVKAEGALRQGAILRDGKTESVCGMAIMLKGENARAVIDRTKARLAQVKLPAGITLNPFYDQSEVINITIETVRKNLFEAGLLVCAVLFIFLGDWRAALIVATVIPLSMLSGFMGMAFFGISANLMSLGAIDFGMIVDGAVVMMENSIRHLHESHSNSKIENIRRSAQEVATPILFGVLIIIAVYIPVLLLEDLEGRMFRPMAIAVCSALLGSLALALFAVPVLSSYFLKDRQPGSAEHHEAKWFVWLSGLYRGGLRGALAHPLLVLFLALIMLGGVIGSVFFMGSEFMPRLDEGSIVVQTKKLPGINVESSVAGSLQVEKIVMSFPEVASIVTKLGRPDVATEAMGVYEADAYVVLKPETRWLSADKKEDLVNRMAEALKQMPGMEFNFTMPMAMRLDETISGVKSDVAVKIFGEDSDTLIHLAEEVEKSLNGIKGMADLQTEVIDGVAELRVTPNRLALARYGLGIRDVQELVDTTSGGVHVSEFIEGQRRYPLMLRFPASERRDWEQIKDLTLRAPRGELVRLREVANVVTGRGPEVINRENGQRRIVVQFNVRGRDLGSVVGDAQAAIARQVKLPAGYWIDYGGQFENQERATRRLAIVLPISILLILTLLYASFRSIGQSLLILCAVPFALIGGIALLWVRGMNLNLSASVGFIALFGVAVLNGIVMVSTINQFRRENAMPVGVAVLEGAVQRLRPVLMTALVAAFGFLPMAFSTTPGSEVQRPLATVVVGGLVSATLLTLFLLPVLYSWFSWKDTKN